MWKWGLGPREASNIWMTKSKSIRMWYISNKGPVDISRRKEFWNWCGEKIGGETHLSHDCVNLFHQRPYNHHHLTCIRLFEHQSSFRGIYSNLSLTWIFTSWLNDHNFERSRFAIENRKAWKKLNFMGCQKKNSLRRLHLTEKNVKWYEIKKLHWNVIL